MHTTDPAGLSHLWRRVFQSKVWVGFEALGEFLGDVRKVDGKGGRFFAYFEADGESMWIEQHNKWRMG